MYIFPLESKFADAELAKRQPRKSLSNFFLKRVLADEDSSKKLLDSPPDISLCGWAPAHAATGPRCLDFPSSFLSAEREIINPGKVSRSWSFLSCHKTLSKAP